MASAFVLACLVSASFVASAPAFVCSEKWPDVCPPQGLVHDGPHDPPCDPWTPLPPGPPDLVAIRAALVAELFGGASGLPTTVLPDAVSVIPGPQTRGCTCSFFGNCNASTSCAWDNQLQELVFTVSVPTASGPLTLNSTVFYTRNTSGVAPSNLRPYTPPDFPDAPAPATTLSETLVLFHNGHNDPCSIPNGDRDYDGGIDWLNQLGYDVMSFHMPAYQVNAPPASTGLIPCDHEQFKPLYAAGVPVFRFFLEPVVRAINYAVSLGYKRIVMAGLSGGGWTTTMLAAIDPRITLSIPVAGSMPCEFAHTSWDFEQGCENKWASIANYSTLYALAALERGRTSVQCIHEQDPCCFHGCGRHDRIRTYNAFVNGVTAGEFRTAVTSGNIHEVNVRDRVIIASLLDKLRIAGELSRADLDTLPFDTMREW